MEFLLVAALSLDTLFACVAYGAQRIRMPLGSRAVVAAVGSGFMGLSLLLGRLLDYLLPDGSIQWIGFLALMVMGCLNLFEHLIKGTLKRFTHDGQTVRFHCFDLSFVLKVYIDNTKADLDQSKRLSPGEALLLALPLSADSLITGLSLTSAWPFSLLLLAFSFLCGMLAAALGNWAGCRIGGGRRDLSWLGGVILILLAIAKL